MKNTNLIISSLVLGLTLVFSGCGSAEPKAPEAEKAPEAKVEAAGETELAEIEKMGFLTVDTCAAAGVFKDCYLENYACGSDGCFKNIEPGVQKPVNIVLYSHKDGITYNLDTTALHAHELDEGINRNDVTIIGKYDAKTNTIIATEFKAPPPPKKSFFKGCL